MELVVKYIVVTAYDEPVSTVLDGKAREEGEKGTVLNRFNVGEVLFFFYYFFFPVSQLTFVVLYVSSLVC